MSRAGLSLSTAHGTAHAGPRDVERPARSVRTRDGLTCPQQLARLARSTVCPEALSLF